MSENEFRIAKVIQIEGPEWNPFTAWLPYLRTFTESYHSGATDEIDKNLLRILQQEFPKSYFKSDILISSPEDLSEFLHRYDSPDRAGLVVYFAPALSYEIIVQAGTRDFTYYPIGFSIRLLFKEGKEINHHLPKELRVELPLDKLERLISTFQNV